MDLTGTGRAFHGPGCLGGSGRRSRCDGFERRLAPYYGRTEPRQGTTASLRSLLSPVEHTHSGPVAEVSGAPAHRLVFSTGGAGH